MKPAPFTYHRASSIEDAVAQLSSEETLARPLAGGQSLLPMLNLRVAPVDRLIDLGRLAELKETQAETACVRYGALLTHAAFEDRCVPDGSNGLMPFVASQIAFRAVRTRGTIGGAIALADPAADWVTTVVAMEASIEIAGPSGKRSVPAAEFVLGPYMVALEPGEIITAVVVPRRSSSERWGHYKVARKIGEYAESMAIALVDRDARNARLVAGATDGAPLVLENAARAVLNGKTGAALASVIREELSASGRDFPATKLHLHCTVCQRAVEAIHS
jgi:aerobic carbon-monoxide dehydrogenase medium subunit